MPVKGVKGRFNVHKDVPHRLLNRSGLPGQLRGGGPHRQRVQPHGGGQVRQRLHPEELPLAPHHGRVLQAALRAAGLRALQQQPEALRRAGPVQGRLPLAPLRGRPHGARAQADEEHPLPPHEPAGAHQPRADGGLHAHQQHLRQPPPGGQQLPDDAVHAARHAVGEDGHPLGQRPPGDAGRRAAAAAGGQQGAAAVRREGPRVEGPGADGRPALPARDRRHRQLPVRGGRPEQLRHQGQDCGGHGVPLRPALRQVDAGLLPEREAHLLPPQRPHGAPLRRGRPKRGRRAG